MAADTLVRDEEAAERESEEAPLLYDRADLYDLMVQPGPCEAFYRQEARRCSGPVLELACGTGRLTLPLARDGHDVTGLDASSSMLATARRKASEGGLSVAFARGDMRHFTLRGRFALIIISCNSLAHLTTNDEVRACLTQVRRHLTPGGTLAFDVVRPDLGVLSRPEDEWRRIDLGPNPSSAIRAEEAASYDPIGQVRTARLRFSCPGQPGEAVAPLVLRQFFPQELPLLLEAAGLELVARYGNFARSPLTPDSLNQICLARARPRTAAASQTLAL